jgi:hypothetical protein
MVSADTLIRTGLHFDHDSQAWIAKEGHNNNNNSKNNNHNHNENGENEYNNNNNNVVVVVQSIYKDSKIKFVVSKIHECDGTISLEGKNPTSSLLVEG